MKISSKLAAVAVCGMLAAWAARADDLADLKAQVQALQARMDAMQRELRQLTGKVERQAARPAVPLAPSPTADPGVWVDIFTDSMGAGGGVRGWAGTDGMATQLLFQTEAQFDAAAVAAPRDARHVRRDEGR